MRQHESYLRHKDKIADRNNKYRDFLRIFYDDYKKGKVCTICGEPDPVCILFHHIDAATKDFNISRIRNAGLSIKKIENELAKCVPVCLNCHRKLHRNQYERHGDSP
jgi:hypothetical protein